MPPEFSSACKNTGKILRQICSYMRNRNRLTRRTFKVCSVYFACKFEGVILIEYLGIEAGLKNVFFN